MQNQARTVRLVTIGLAVLVASMFASFAWILVSPIDLPFQRVERSMQVTSRLDGQTLPVAGTTDLPDGAFIDWYASSVSSDSNELPSGQVAVQSGAFGFDVLLAELPSGAATAYVSFSCDWGTVQSKQVTDLVGEHCEHLDGEQVYVDSPGDPKQLFVTVEFTVP